MTELKLEIGKCYVDELECKYMVMAKSGVEYVAFCYEDDSVSYHESDGGIRDHCGGSDLIAECKEPVVAKGFLLVHDNSRTIDAFTTEELRDQTYIDVPAKMLRVDITVDITNKTASVEVI